MKRETLAKLKHESDGKDITVGDLLPEASKLLMKGAQASRQEYTDACVAGAINLLVRYLEFKYE